MAFINSDQQGSSDYLPQVQPNSALTDPTQTTDPTVAPPTTAPTSGAAPTGGSSMNMPAGIDPRLASLYQQYGLQPGGSGSGFADWQYWQDKANSIGDWNYITNRLGADLAGTGSDAPTGTPGTGGWSTSGGGGGASGGSSASLPGFDFGGLLSGMFSNTFSPYQQSPQDQNLYGMLNTRANQSLNVSPNDPIIKQQVDAARAENDRAAKNIESASAESGGAFGNNDAAVRSAQEKSAQATTGLQATLMQNELNARRSEIQNALSEMGSVLSVQDQLALQKQLGLLDSALRGYGVQSQNDQFAANYDLNSTNQANYWDALRSGLLG